MLLEFYHNTLKLLNNSILKMSSLVLVQLQIGPFPLHVFSLWELWGSCPQRPNIKVLHSVQVCPVSTFCCSCVLIICTYSYMLTIRISWHCSIGTHFSFRSQQHCLPRAKGLDHVPKFLTTQKKHSFFVWRLQKNKIVTKGY